VILDVARLSTTINEARSWFRHSDWLALPLRAQLAAPNAAGVGLGQIHLIVKDVAAERRFFIEMMGGTPVDNEKISMIQFPGVF